ncbi:serine protease inhibitor [Arthrobacter monumenti]
MKPASAVRHLRAAPRFAVAAVTVLLLAGCGGSLGTEPASKAPTPKTPATAPTSPAPNSPPPSETAAVPTSSPSPASPAPEPDDGNFNVELRITVIPEPGATPQEYLLQCDGTTPGSASNVPDPKEACVLMEESARALFFTKPDPTLQCTQQYGGPQTAVVLGTIDNRPVEAEFARTNGCEIDRWEAMEPVLGPGGVM